MLFSYTIFFYKAYAIYKYNHHLLCQLPWVPPIPGAQRIVDGHVSGAAGYSTGLAFVTSKPATAVFKNLAINVLDKEYPNVISILHRCRLVLLSVLHI